MKLKISANCLHSSLDSTAALITGVRPHLMHCTAAFIGSDFEEEVRLGQHGSRGVRICTDLIRAINSAQISRSTDSVRLGKFGTNFEVFYCCINYCTAALNFGTCPEICTACQLYGRCLIWHGNRGTVRLGFEGQFVYLMLKELLLVEIS